MTDRSIALNDAYTILRDAREALCALDPKGDHDEITEAIRRTEDTEGDLWKASALAEEADAVSASRRAWRDETLSAGQMG